MPCDAQYRYVAGHHRDVVKAKPAAGTGLLGFLKTDGALSNPNGKSAISSMTRNIFP
jgi:hypothetical protein